MEPSESSRKYVFIGLPDDKKDYYDECVPSVCPFCEVCAYGFIQFEDYVDIPMLWCQECCAKGVLDIGWKNAGDDLYDLVKKCERVDVDVDVVPTTDYCSWLDPKTYGGHYSYYKVPLYWIFRVVNNELSKFSCHDVLSDDLVKEFVRRNYDEEYGKKVGIFQRELPDEGDTYLKWKKEVCIEESPDDFGSHSKWKEEMWVDSWKEYGFWNLSMICDSYSVSDVSKAYSGCELRHDGIYVYLKIQKDGKEECIRFCGD